MSREYQFGFSRNNKSVYDTVGRGRYYYEKHLSYWGLRSRVSRFNYIDYTKKLVFESKNSGPTIWSGPGHLKKRW